MYPALEPDEVCATQGHKPNLMFGERKVDSIQVLASFLSYRQTFELQTRYPSPLTRREGKLRCYPQYAHMKIRSFLRSRHVTNNFARSVLL